MIRSRGALFAFASFAALALPRTARADLVKLPSDGTVAVEIAPDHTSLRVSGSKPITIKPPPGASAWPRETRAARIDVGNGRSVMHVSLPLTDGTWDWLGTDAGDVLFEAAQTRAAADAGTVPTLRMLTSSDTSRPPMLVRGDIDERVRLCGKRETLLTPQGLDPKTLTWKRATLQQLSSRERDTATRLTAAPLTAREPLPPVLVLDAFAASSGEARAATDGNPKSAWSEERPGIGQGELLIARAGGARLDALTLLLGGDDGRDAPATFYVLTDDAIFHVTAPAAPSKSGDDWLRVVFPAPVTTQCLAVVLDTAHSDNRDARVSVRELRAVTPDDQNAQFPAELAARAAKDDDARRLVSRVSVTGRATLEAQFARLTPEARRAVLEALEPLLPCEDMAHLEALALTDKKLAPNATRFFDRCTTRAARGLAGAFAAADAKARGDIAPMLALLARKDATPLLVKSLGDGDRVTRAHVAGALARLVSAQTDVERAELAARAASLPPPAFVDLLVAFGAHARAQSTVFAPRVRELATAADRDTAWDLVPALAALGDDPALAATYDAFLQHESAALRVRAATQAPTRATGALAARLADASPRVREAAWDRLAALDAVDASATDALMQRGLADDFAFVRVATARALARGKRASSDALLAKGAREDHVLRVRVAALDALAARPTPRLESFEEIAFDPELAPELRASALTALEARCRTGDPARVEKMARNLASPIDPGDYAVAFAAYRVLVAARPELAKKLREEIARTGKNATLLAALDRLERPRCTAR